MDRRQLLIAGVIAPLAVLVVVLAIVLLRGSDVPPPAAPARDERPPGAGTAPAEAPADTPDAPPAYHAAPEPADAPVADDLEAPPRREPRPAAAPNAEAFAEDFLRRQGADSVSDLLGLYGTAGGQGVRYYSMGRVDAQTIADDKDAYFRRFPDRSYGLASAVRVTPGAGGALTLRFDYDYSAGGGAGGERAGTAWTELDVVPAGGTYLITGEHGAVY